MRVSLIGDPNLGVERGKHGGEEGGKEGEVEEGKWMSV